MEGGGEERRRLEEIGPLVGLAVAVCIPNTAVDHLVHHLGATRKRAGRETDSEILLSCTTRWNLTS